MTPTARLVSSALHASAVQATTDWRRTHTCGDLRASHVGSTVTLNGWVAARRDHGGIYFVDLRDRYGITQVVLGTELADAVKLGPEFTISVRGKVIARDAANVNPDRPTGAVEVVADRLEILSRSKTPPFPIDGEEEVSLETRLKYRYLDLRRAGMRGNLVHRSRFIHAMRSAFLRQNFVEVETPILTKATPEGARDYLVPSRVHPGEFYALPQSPQIFKQILMVAGLDRYFQVARCFRDEDLRADRQPEFTQLDMEMSFVEEDDIFRTWEQVLHETFRDAMGVEVAIPFPRMSWLDAMERYGVDKPDVRFGLELRDAGAWAKTCEFGLFRDAIANGGRVKALVVPPSHELSRKDVEDGLTGIAKSAGAGGLAWWKAGKEGGVGPLARFCKGEAAAALMTAIGANEGDMCLFAAGARNTVWKVLGEIRNHLGKRFGLVKPGTWSFTWVTQFPMFEWDADSKRWFSAHHPFTAPVEWDLGGADVDASSPKLGDLFSRAYDLVMNGWELGSGSVRIHKSDVQQRIFTILGIGPEEQERKFGGLLEALSYGAPPHAGFAIGLDRLTALSMGLDNIRDMIAFPKTASATDLMCDAPSIVDPAQLAEVHIRTTLPAAKAPATAAPAAPPKQP
ncbi:MAG: aspartate--tRNA ligase [Planctomycetota bacterium]|nr:aspartate--tRNA ligase [Planctomycetota bacterium]